MADVGSTLGHDASTNAELSNTYTSTQHRLPKSGDIHINPGPVKKHCKQCHSP